MTALPDPGTGSAAATAAPAAAAAGADRFAEELLRALPEPALLVTSAGVILAANTAAGILFGAPAAVLRGTRLTEHVDDAPHDVGRYLDACARTRSPIPGALHPRAAGTASASAAYAPAAAGAAPPRQSIAGAAVRPPAPGQPAVVLLRVRADQGTSNRFALLNRQLVELTREVRARRAAEAALHEANTHLEHQALELELANQQLQDQALELEQQIEQATVFASELERANDGLAETAAAAAEARALAEQANRAKTEFLAVMSHELRTPLNAIGGYAELIALGVRGPVTEAQRTDLERIQRSQRHLLALINEVLNFTRLDAGQVRFSVAPVPVDGLLGGLEVLIAPQVRAQGLRFVYEGAAPSVVAQADPEKLQQVLLNLLSNAIKFTPSGGTVTLAGELADGPAGDAQVRIRVRDTGIGIASDHLERVFEPFVQLDQRLTRMHEGVGLGLAISRDLMRGMGGELSAESTPGEGSTFTVTLPAGL